MGKYIKFGKYTVYVPDDSDPSLVERIMNATNDEEVAEGYRKLVQEENKNKNKDE